MGLRINNVRPNTITTNGTEIFNVNVTRNGITDCYWGKKFSLNLPSVNGGTFTVNKTALGCNEDTLKTLSSSDYIYSNDTVTITATPNENYALVNIYVTVKNGNSYSSNTSPYTIQITPGVLGQSASGTEISIYPTFQAVGEAWHIIYSSSYSFTQSSSTSSFTTKLYTPIGYRGTDLTKVRIDAKLYRKKTSESSWTLLNTYTSNTGDITYTDSTVSTSAKQYLYILSTGIQSKVKRYKKSLTTYSYYWQLTKVEEYY